MNDVLATKTNCSNVVEAKSTPLDLETSKRWGSTVSIGISVSCKSHISPEILRILGVLKVTLLEDLPLMSWYHSRNTVCCLYSRAKAWQTPFDSGTLVGMCRQKRMMQHESLAPGGQSFPARLGFQLMPQISRSWRKETLFGTEPESMYLLCFQEIFVSLE